MQRHGTSLADIIGKFSTTDTQLKCRLLHRTTQCHFIDVK
jgi:hypothetical protein